MGRGNPIPQGIRRFGRNTLAGASRRDGHRRPQSAPIPGVVLAPRMRSRPSRYSRIRQGSVNGAPLVAPDFAPASSLTSPVSIPIFAPSWRWPFRQEPVGASWRRCVGVTSTSGEDRSASFERSLMPRAVRFCARPRRAVPIESISTPTVSRSWRLTTTGRCNEHDDPGVDFDRLSFVFSQDRRTPWPPNWVTKRFIAYRRAAKVDCRLHDLRHFMATTMLTAGVPITTVSARLSHAEHRPPERLRPRRPGR